MTGLRNSLITVGAAFGADYIVSAFRWWLLYPLTGLGVAKGSPESALAWAMGTGSVVAVLAGVGAGIAVQTSRPIGWSLLLAFLASATSMSRTAFPDAFSLALAEFGTSAITAAIALGSFHYARGLFLKRNAVAAAR